MRVFVLCTGRTGSTSFAKACSYIQNYTSGHETRATFLGASRVEYPDQHIEVDNRLSWFLGELDAKFGDEAIYIHLKRDYEKVLRSFMNRWTGRSSIVRAYCEGIKETPTEKLNKEQRLQICRDYINTVTVNIDHFLKDKTRTLEMNLETIKTDFPKFWELINAEGDLAAALQTFEVQHNASPKGTFEEFVVRKRYDVKLLLLRVWRSLTKG